jgi:F-type H+-transporting ATPase subunit delta
MAKGSIKIAGRYAKALSELYPVNELDSVQASLKEFVKVWRENPSLSEALINPAFSMNDRISAAKEVAVKIKPNDEKFANFISLLCQAGRISEVAVVTDAFSALVDRIKKLLSLKVTSAFDIGDGEKENFKNHIHKEFGSLASVEWDMNPEIIGGLRVRAGDKLLDSSIKGALQRLENTLLS